MARRRSRARSRSQYLVPSSRAGSVLLGSGRSSGGRRGRGRRAFGRLLALVVLLGAAGAIGYFVWDSQQQTGKQDRAAAAAAFTTAWGKGDRGGMYAALSPRSRAAMSQEEFDATYASAYKTAGVNRIQVGTPAAEQQGLITVPVVATTDDFGTLRGTVSLPVTGEKSDAGVVWDATLRLPGLRRGEAVRLRAGSAPRQGEVLAADGTLLDATGLGQAVAGSSGSSPTGLNRIYASRLNGHPAESLRFGKRTIARTKAVRGRSVRTTLRPKLMTTANTALGDKIGGIAVLRPSDGAILAVAGLAVSAPQPPGSTFKIITLAAALEHGVAKPTSTYPVRTAATLSGVKLTNASGESCGGTLSKSFADSCNSVFAPLGAKLGAKKLVAAAEGFGFNEELSQIPALKPSTIGPAGKLTDDLAVGAAAIGQDTDLATPLQMASVGAAIALDGKRARPRMTTLEKVKRTRAVSAKTAHEVRTMMIDVVQSGTGTAGAIPGVTVAGKTGTAELKPNSTDPKDADAWFVAFAPAENPKVAVAVMLVGAGFGGTAAAPVARQVLQAALAG
jgi:peptidoglycan glycosyltransferase